MRRIDFIVRGKGVLKNMLDRNVNRINRTVKSAIDSVNDNIDELDVKIEEIINSLGNDPKDSESMNKIIDQYLDLRHERESALYDLDSLNKLKGKLEEEVEVEVEDEEK